MFVKHFKKQTNLQLQSACDWNVSWCFNTETTRLYINVEILTNVLSFWNYDTSVHQHFSILAHKIASKIKYICLGRHWIQSHNIKVDLLCKIETKLISESTFVIEMLAEVYELCMEESPNSLIFYHRKQPHISCNKKMHTDYQNNTTEQTSAMWLKGIQMALVKSKDQWIKFSKSHNWPDSYYRCCSKLTETTLNNLHMVLIF